MGRYRVAINGFGRIGRNYLRRLLDRNCSTTTSQVVGINDLWDAGHPGAPARVRLDVRPAAPRRRLRRTPPHRRPAPDPDVRRADPAALPWADLGVDLVIESTGKLRTRDDAALHLKAGARRVLISAPGKDVDATLVPGVNADDVRPGAAPDRVRRVVHDELRRADGEGAARGVRAGARLPDHGARVHQRPDASSTRRTRTRAGPARPRSTSSRPAPARPRPSAWCCPNWPAASTASRCGCRSSTARSAT